MLNKFQRLSHLSLHSNQIRTLPADLSALQIESIDISENPLQDLTEACSSLKTIPNLKHLVIDLTDEQEVEVILSHLNLTTLNDKEVSADHEVNDEMILTDHQNELEHIAELYDNLRDTLRDNNIGNDDEYANEFDSISKNVICEIRQSATSSNQQETNLVISENKIKL